MISKRWSGDPRKVWGMARPFCVYDRCCSSQSPHEYHIIVVIDRFAMDANFSFSELRKSIGINTFWLDGLVGFFCVLLGKNPFWLAWLINRFNQRWNGRKVICLIMLRARSSHNDYSQELPRFNQKNGWKSVLLRRVNRINPNRLRLKRLIPIEHDLSVVISVVRHSPCEGY